MSGWRGDGLVDPFSHFTEARNKSHFTYLGQRLVQPWKKNPTLLCVVDVFTHLLHRLGLCVGKSAVLCSCIMCAHSCWQREVMYKEQRTGRPLTTGLLVQFPTPQVSESMSLGKPWTQNGSWCCVCKRKKIYLNIVEFLFIYVLSKCTKVLWFWFWFWIVIYLLASCPQHFEENVEFLSATLWQIYYGFLLIILMGNTN